MNERLKVYDEKMQKTCKFLTDDLATIRAGRANPRVLDKVRVDYYGNISVPEARISQIAPYDKTMLKEIEKALLASDIGITPTNDGTNIRLVFPELTEERRKQLSKDVKKKGEDAKVALRNIRRDGGDMVKKLKGTDVSEDEQKDMENELQKMTDKYVKEIDKAVEEKSKEIMTV